MQPRQDQFHAGDLLLRVQVDRHPAPVVFDLEGAVLEHRDVDPLAVTGQRLVDAIVDHFLGEVVRAARVRVHPRPTTNRVQSAEDFDV